MRFLSWLFCIVTATLLVLAISSPNNIFEPHQIESVLRNTCQSGDLLPDFPKCPYQ